MSAQRLDWLGEAAGTPVCDAPDDELLGISAADLGPKNRSLFVQNLQTAAPLSNPSPGKCDCGHNESLLTNLKDLELIRSSPNVKTCNVTSPQSAPIRRRFINAGCVQRLNLCLLLLKEAGRGGKTTAIHYWSAVNRTSLALHPLL